MCCACGGGLTREEQVPYSEPTCQDTNKRSLTDGTNEEITDSYGDTCDWYDSKINNTFCGKFDTDEFEAEEMCCVCGGGYTQESLSLAAKYLGKDSIAGKYLPKDISYAGYAAIAVFALPTFLFMTLSSPFLLIAQMLGADFM